jgi:hypothetical protein
VAVNKAIVDSDRVGKRVRQQQTLCERGSVALGATQVSLRASIELVYNSREALGRPAADSPMDGDHRVLLPSPEAKAALERAVKASLCGPERPRLEHA